MTEWCSVRSTWVQHVVSYLTHRNKTWEGGGGGGLHTCMIHVICCLDQGLYMSLINGGLIPGLDGHRCILKTLDPALTLMHLWGTDGGRWESVRRFSGFLTAKAHHDAELFDDVQLLISEWQIVPQIHSQFRFWMSAFSLNTSLSLCPFSPVFYESYGILDQVTPEINFLIFLKYIPFQLNTVKLTCFLSFCTSPMQIQYTCVNLFTFFFFTRFFFYLFLSIPLPFLIFIL